MVLTAQQRLQLTLSYFRPEVQAEEEGAQKIQARRLVELIKDNEQEMAEAIAAAWLKKYWREGWHAGGGPDLGDSDNHDR